MNKLANAVDTVCSVISGISLAGLIVVNFADSIGRQIRMPLLGAQEIASFLLLIFFFSAIPILIRENAQIRVGLLVDLYKPLLARVEMIWSNMFEIVGMLLLAFLVLGFAMRSHRIGALSAHFRIEIAPFVYFAAFCAFLSLFFIAERLFSRARTADEDGTEPGPKGKSEK